MKYIINNFNLTDLQAKLKGILSKKLSKINIIKESNKKYFHILICVMIIMLITINFIERFS
ncbi:hypothetical protein [Spiroplasma poulsonii]|uniref:hypothetical protein n=1 Tax=Spiroplasma poulsonii TaxID=2138 RepID=UPI001F4CD03C|nr:hypothetical protein [Spiroplasma poulsonii]UNF61186.1 hypothetical protein MNU24_04530 [Spiroplasma poulsonii]